MRERVMDFLERLFNFSPDGGDGSIKVLLVIGLLLVGTAIWMSSVRTANKKGRICAAPGPVPEMRIPTCGVDPQGLLPISIKSKCFDLRGAKNQNATSLRPMLGAELLRLLFPPPDEQIAATKDAAKQRQRAGDRRLFYLDAATNQWVACCVGSRKAS